MPGTALHHALRSARRWAGDRVYRLLEGKERIADLPPAAWPSLVATADALVATWPRVFTRAACALCGSTDSEPAVAGFRPLGARLYRGGPRLPRRARRRIPLIYCECRGCGAARIDPTLHRSWIDFCAPDAREGALTEQTEDQAYVLDKQQSIAGHYRVLDLDRFRSRANAVLDVSCSTGVGLSTLRDQLGWSDCRGVECDPAAVAAAQRRGLAVQQGFIYDAELPHGHFDLVVLDNALEHHWDPRAALRQVRRCLRPEGAALIIVPNFHGYAVQRLGVRYCNVNWGHWHYFTVQSLHRLLREEGLSLQRARCDGVEQVAAEAMGGAIPADAWLDRPGGAIAGLPPRERIFRGDYITLLATAPPA